MSGLYSEISGCHRESRDIGDIQTSQCTNGFQRDIGDIRTSQCTNGFQRDIGDIQTSQCTNSFQGTYEHLSVPMASRGHTDIIPALGGGGLGSKSVRQLKHRAAEASGRRREGKRERGGSASLGKA